MKQFWMAALTVARRDFMAIVATPSFLLFLLAPLLFIGLGVGSALGTRSLASNDGDAPQLSIIMPAQDLMLLKEADSKLRLAMPPSADIARIGFRTPTVDRDDYLKEMDGDNGRLLALMYGTLDAPHLLQRHKNSSSAEYLNLVLEQARASRVAGSNVDPAVERQIIPFPPKAREGSTFKASQMISLAAISAIFMITLLLATQSISSIAEEKSNKVIEILAAAVPLEGVFVGKLMAMMGVGILFIAFWALIATVGGTAASIWMASMPAGAAMPDATAELSKYAPAVGWTAFLWLVLAYMITNFMLYGSLFLGIGSLAATTREIQMLSFPITILQMIAYFIPLSNLKGNSDGAFQRFAEIFPFTSPYSMVSKAALDPNISWHVAAVLWQGLWVTIVIMLSVKMFRRGVLGGEQAWKFWKKS
jgi:ABC-2 type transport system permease protein